jgi:hypothetical protein
MSDANSGVSGALRVPIFSSTPLLLCLLCLAMDRACSMHGDKRDSYRIFVGKSQGKRSVGRARRRWAYNVKLDLKRYRMGGMD